MLLVRKSVNAGGREQCPALSLAQIRVPSAIWREIFAVVGGRDHRRRNGIRSRGCDDEPTRCPDLGNKLLKGQFADLAGSPQYISTYVSYDIIVYTQAR